ncbi:MAG: hypothetical protein R2697_08520 [Ilumatobacteraceae bacterium]
MSIDDDVGLGEGQTSMAPIDPIAAVAPGPTTTSRSSLVATDGCAAPSPPT